MTLGRKAGLLAAAVLFPPTIAISAFTAWSGATQIGELTQRNLVLELSRFQETVADEYRTLSALSLETVDFYRANAQRKVVDWAKANGSPGFLYILGREGERILAPQLPLKQARFTQAGFEPWGWTLGAAISKSYLDSFGWQAFWNTVWIDLAIALPLIFAAVALSRSISRPVENLRAAAESLSAGDLTARAEPAGTPEIRSLALAFNSMATHLQDLTSSLEDRVRARTQDLERSMAEVARQERLASLGSLVGGVAHEINTPLGICVTSASTLDNETEKLEKLYREGTMSQTDFESFLETLKEGLHLLDVNLSRSHELVSSFKRLSVNQSAEQQKRFAPLEYLHDVVNSLSHELKVAGVTVELTGDGSQVWGDPGLLSQVVLNLMTNSLEHGFEGVRGGLIRIHSERTGSEFRLAYSDNGRGMDESTLKRLYEPYFTTKPQNGSGLGMSLVYAIVARWGGTIQVKSQPSKGTRYRVVVPLP